MDINTPIGYVLQWVMPHWSTSTTIIFGLKSFFLHKVSNIITDKQKQVDYQELLNKTKAENNFDREIQLTKELEQLTVKLEQTESDINSIIYKLYQIEPTEIAVNLYFKHIEEQGYIEIKSN